MYVKIIGFERFFGLINKVPDFLNPIVESTKIEVEFLNVFSKTFVFLVDSKFNINDVRSKEIS